MFGMNIGTKKGDTRSGPLRMNAAQFSSKVSMPPMPLPITTPTRLGSAALPAMPASVTAWCAAAIAYWANRS